MVGTLDSQIIKKFKEFQTETNQYNDLNIEDVKFKNIPLEKIANFPSLSYTYGKVDLTIDEYKQLNLKEKENYYPLVGASLENNQISGYVFKDRLTENSLSNKNVITWTRVDASKFFIQEKEVTINDDSFVMDVNEDFDLKYVKFATNSILLSQIYNWGKKATKSKVRNNSIPIPIGLNDKYNSIEIQNIISNFIDFWDNNYVAKFNKRINQKNNIYKKIKKVLLSSTFSLDEKLIELFNKFASEKDITLKLEDISFIEEAFKLKVDFISGNTEYTKEYYRKIENKGKYPLMTGSLNAVASVKEIMTNHIIDSLPSISFNKDNDAGSKAFYHEKPFIVGGHHYRVKLKDEFEEDIYCKYIYYLLQKVFDRKKFYQKKAPRANSSVIGEELFFIPKSKGRYSSLDIQKILVEFWEKIMQNIDNKLENFDKMLDLTDTFSKALLYQTFNNIEAKKEVFDD